MDFLQNLNFCPSTFELSAAFHWIFKENIRCNKYFHKTE